jgi:hypothetical protein
LKDLPSIVTPLLYGNVRFIVMWTRLFSLLRYRGILICNSIMVLIVLPTSDVIPPIYKFSLPLFTSKI